MELRQGLKCHYFSWVVQDQGEWWKKWKSLNTEEKILNRCIYSASRTLQEGWQKNTLQIVHRRGEGKGFVCLLPHTSYFPLVRFPGVLTPFNWLLTGDIIQIFQCPQLSPSNLVHLWCCRQCSFSKELCVASLCLCLQWLWTYSITIASPMVQLRALPDTHSLLQPSFLMVETWCWIKG